MLKAKAWIKLSLLLLIFLFLVSAIAAYFGPNPYSKAYLKIVPLPAAFVGTSSVRLSDYYQRVALAQRLKEFSSRSDILNKEIQDLKIEKLVRARGISVTTDEINQAYQTEISNLGTSDIEKTFGLTPSYFKDEFVTQDLLQEKLAIWLASQRDLNPEAYAKLNQAQNDLNNGVVFEDAAQKYSDDTLNAKIGGDLGFVGNADILPELYQAAAQIKDQNTHLVVSRLGLHLIQVLGSDNSGPNQNVRYHIRQIFIKTADFQTWLQNQKINFFRLV